MQHHKLLNNSRFIVSTIAFINLISVNLVHAQPRDFRGFVEIAVDLLNDLIVVLIGIGVLVFLWGIVKYISASDDTEAIKSARQFIIYGIIGIFVMLSVWGLVFIVTNSLELQNNNLPEPRPLNWDGGGGK